MESRGHVNGDTGYRGPRARHAITAQESLVPHRRMPKERRAPRAEEEGARGGAGRPGKWHAKTGLVTLARPGFQGPGPAPHVVTPLCPWAAPQGPSW